MAASPPATELSVVVVTWECAGALAELVETMSRLAAGAELIVVDNASSDHPGTALAGWTGSSTLIRRADNAGYGVAANEGVAAARHEAIVLLNPDTHLLDDGLPGLARFAVERGVLAGPRVVNPDGSLQASASGAPTGAWPWVGALIPGRLQPGPIRRRAEPWRLRRPARVCWLAGSCVAGARTALRALGPFDPAIHLYGEDMDLGLRAAEAGIESWIVPDLCAISHEGRRSSSIRFAEGPEPRIELTRRAVVRRAAGPRREHAGWLARRLNLRLRTAAKRLLGRDATRDRAALDAARAAREVPALPGGACR